LVLIARECAGPRATGKPLDLAVDDVPGTTEATQHRRSVTDAFPPALAEQVSSTAP